jgi:ATP-dependent RNA helicase DeaD
LNVGRKHTAEARWLLPMLCRAGHITKNEIGAIRIHMNETHVELEPGAVDRFLEAVGPSRKVEKTITVTRLDGIPAEPKDGAADVRGAPYANKKREFGGPKPGSKRKYEKASIRPSEGDDFADKKPYEKKSYETQESDKKPYVKKEWPKTDGKPKTKKSYKPKTTESKGDVKPIGKPTRRPTSLGAPKVKSKSGKFTKPGGKSKGPAKLGGSAPMKRKTLRVKGS